MAHRSKLVTKLRVILSIWQISRWIIIPIYLTNGVPICLTFVEGGGGMHLQEHRCCVVWLAKRLNPPTDVHISPGKRKWHVSVQNLDTSSTNDTRTNANQFLLGHTHTHCLIWYDHLLIHSALWFELCLRHFLVSVIISLEREETQNQTVCLLKGFNKYTDTILCGHTWTWKHRAASNWKDNCV